MSEQMDAAVKAAQAVLAAFYVENITGGAVHIVTDDFNLEDDSVAWCVQYAKEKGDEQGLAMAEMLAAFPLEQRALVCVPSVCKCGHSTALHYEDHGEWGFSQSGPCGLDGCDCTDCERIE